MTSPGLTFRERVFSTGRISCMAKGGLLARSPARAQAEGPTAAMNRTAAPARLRVRTMIAEKPMPTRRMVAGSMNSVSRSYRG
ncbi:hypothetical protein D3C87_1130510 [compost metagenome]